MKRSLLIKSFIPYIFLILLGFAKADVSLTLNQNSTSYNYGEPIVISATISNAGSTAVSASISFLVKNKEMGYIAGPQSYPITIKAGSTKTIVLYNKKAGKDVPAGLYSITVNLIANGTIAGKSEKEFFVRSKLKNMELAIESCKDQTSTKKAKVFTKGETVYLKYKTSLKPKIDANLALPDKTTKQISLPFSFRAGQLGTYNLTVKASKEG